MTAAAALTGLSGCDSFLKEYSQDLAKVNTWEDLDEVLIGSAYLHTGRYVSQNSYYSLERDKDFDILHYMSDELTMGNTSSNIRECYEAMFPFFTWQQDTGTDYQLRYSGGDAVYFDAPYARINVCNMVLAVIDDLPEPSEEDVMQKRRVKGEAFFLRALYYFTLANLYGEPYDPATSESKPGVPLKFSEVVEDVEYSRGTIKDTYMAILADLDQAEELLSHCAARKSVYRADINTVHLLQSRVALYMQNWDEAIAKAKAVIDANGQLMNLAVKTPGETCLDASCPELLFSMGDYIIAFNFRDSRYDGPGLMISDDMLALYDDNDLRKTRYIGETSRGRKNVFMKVNGQDESMGSYTQCGSVFTFRTAEAYLNIAEASAYNGDETTARTMLGKVRSSRITGDASVSATGNDLIDIIRDERAREFLLEGHRWYDLRRYTVCNKYPWSKEIVHGFIYESDFDFDHEDWYRLEKNDQAYTLPLPRDIITFQPTLGNNPRPSRMAFDVSQTWATSYGALSEEGGDDDWNDDDYPDEEDW